MIGTAVRERLSQKPPQDAAPDAGGGSRVLLRRQLAVALFLVAGIAAGVLGWNSTTLQYETSGAVVVIPPGAGSRVARDNPLYRLSDTAQLANVLAGIALSAEGQRIVANAGASPEYKVRRMAGTSNVNSELSAQLTLSVRAPGMWAAREAAMGLIGLMRERLFALQRDAGLRDFTYADLRVAVEPPPGAPVAGNSVRAAIGYAITAMLALALLFVLRMSQRDTAVRRGVGRGEALPDACAERIGS